MDADGGSPAAGDLRLSLLLSQLVGSQEVRELLALQLADWHQLQADGFIQDERLRIFCLLAGKPVSGVALAFFPSRWLLWLLSLFQPCVSPLQVWQLSEKRTINVCSQLDWKRSLGVHLWYLLPSTAPLSKALSMYEAAFQVGSRGGRPGQQGPLECRPPSELAVCLGKRAVMAGKWAGPFSFLSLLHLMPSERARHPHHPH